MTGLAEVLRGLAARDGVQGALLLSGEGLPIEHAPADGFERDTVAALAAALAQCADRLGEGAERGELRTAVLEFARGPMVLARAGTSSSEEHTSELQSPCNLVRRLLPETTPYDATKTSASAT